MIFRYLIFEAEVIKQQLRAGVVSHHEQQASEHCTEQQHRWPAYNANLAPPQASTEGLFQQTRLLTSTEHGLEPRWMLKNARASCGLPEKARAFYGASRSASDATTLLYTTTSVLRGRRTPPFGSVGSCVASYRLFLDSILVKVFASVTKNRDVSLLC